MFSERTIEWIWRAVYYTDSQRFPNNFILTFIIFIFKTFNFSKQKQKTYKSSSPISSTPAPFFLRLPICSLRDYIVFVFLCLINFTEHNALKIYPNYIYIYAFSLSINSSKDINVSFSWLLQIMLQWAWG